MAKNFEYHIEEIPLSATTQEVENRCNILGSEGWHLTFIGQMGGIRMCFEREVPSETTSPYPGRR